MDEALGHGDPRAKQRAWYKFFVPQRTHRTTPKRSKPSDPPLPIDRPGLASVVTDFSISSLWEALRQIGRPASVKELASVLGRSEAKVIEALDALRQVRLVRRLAATTRHPEIRFTTTARRIVLAWDPRNSLHQAIHSQIGGVFEAKSRSQIGELMRGTDPALGKRYSDRRLFWGRFTEEDLKQFQALVGQLDLLMMRIGSRPFQNAGTGASDHEVAPRCNYHVAFAIIPTHEEFPPLARIQAERAANTPYDERHVAAAAFSSLTPREREVFDQLLTGRSLAQIGKSLGISRATVATLAKHCYRKFRVRGRQELAAATLGLSP